MKKRNRKAKIAPHDNRSGQCRDCTVTYCPTATIEACAHMVFLAIEAGTIYECPDRGTPYWETMCA